MLRHSHSGRLEGILDHFGHFGLFRTVLTIVVQLFQMVKIVQNVPKLPEMVHNGLIKGLEEFQTHMSEYMLIFPS